MSAPKRIRSPGELEAQRARHGQEKGRYRAMREADGKVRRRYHGKAQRGAPIAPVADGFELTIALDTLKRARDLLAKAATLPPGIERREAHKEAIAQVALAGRACDELVIRRGGVLS